MPHLMASRCSADDMDGVHRTSAECVCLQFFFGLKAQQFFFSSIFFVYMSKCCGRARSASQKCKIKGKWKSDRRWKRAIRPATVEWVSAVLSDTVRRHYKLRWLWCPSTGSRAVIATIRHFVTHHYEFGSVRPLQKPTWALSVFILLAVTLT